MPPQSSWELISRNLKGGWSQETKKLVFFPFAPAPHLCLCLSLDFVLHCLKAWEFASYQWKWPHLKIKCYSAPCVAKPGSDYFCALVLCHLCTLPMAGRPVWFSPPHFGCLGEKSIGKSSRSCWKACVPLSLYHITQSHGHSAQMPYLFPLFTSFVSLLPWQLPVYQKMIACKLLTVSVANN